MAIAVAAVTTTRTRRVRCAQGTTASGLQTTGCNELFSRDDLTEGLCSRCRTLVEMVDMNGQTFLAITEPTYWGEQELAANGVTTQTVAHEIRCRSCREWVDFEIMVDGTCPECVERTRVDLAAATLAAQTPTCDTCHQAQTPANEVNWNDDEGMALCFECANPAPVQTPVAPAAPRTTSRPRNRKLPNSWDVIIDGGGDNVTIHRSGIEFDTAQQVAKEIAKMYTTETGHKSQWTDVKTWVCAGAIICISRHESEAGQ